MYYLFAVAFCEVFQKTFVIGFVESSVFFPFLDSKIFGGRENFLRIPFFVIFFVLFIQKKLFLPFFTKILKWKKNAGGKHEY